MNKTPTLKGKEMYLVAEGIARGAHAGGFRRDKKTPYFKHVKQVADRLKGWDLKTIGILHDTLEDTKLKEDDLIDAGFPERIINGVKAMTKPEMEYFTYINKQILGNADARLVKLADLACNIKGNGDAKQKAKYLKAQKILRAYKPKKTGVGRFMTDLSSNGNHAPRRFHAIDPKSGDTFGVITCDGKKYEWGVIFTDYLRWFETIKEADHANRWNHGVVVPLKEIPYGDIK
jgi:(p)ppGpp synthase/HD superfamily hydrolase